MVFCVYCDRSIDISEYWRSSLCSLDTFFSVAFDCLFGFTQLRHFSLRRSFSFSLSLSLPSSLSPPPLTLSSHYSHSSVFLLIFFSVRAWYLRHLLYGICIFIPQCCSSERRQAAKVLAHSTYFPLSLPIVHTIIVLLFPASQAHIAYDERKQQLNELDNFEYFGQDPFHFLHRYTVFVDFSNAINKISQINRGKGNVDASIAHKHEKSTRVHISKYLYIYFKCIFMVSSI